VYPAPNCVARLFRFDGNSGFAKSWWLYESTMFFWSKTSCPRTSFDDGQLFKEIVVTESGSRCIPMSKPVPKFYKIPIYIYIFFFLRGVA